MKEMSSLVSESHPTTEQQQKPCINWTNINIKMYNITKMMLFVGTLGLLDSAALGPALGASLGAISEGNNLF